MNSDIGSAGRPGRSRLWGQLLSVFGLVLFAAALAALHHELREYRYQDIAAHFRALPSSRLLAAVTLTVLSYLELTLYEWLAFRQIGHSLPYRKIALGSFIGYAFSNNVGFGMISGTAVRGRLYTAWGLSGLELARVVLFCTVSFWLGFLAMAGLAFVFEPLQIPAALHLPVSSLQPLGLAFLGVVSAYILWSATGRRPLPLGGWQLLPPSLRVSLAQLAISSMEWILSSAVLFVILPAGVAGSFPRFLGKYLLAGLAGMLSQIPGGLGVFETAMLWLLAPKNPAAVVASFVAYRGLFYLGPLAVAAVLLGWQEAHQRWAHLQRLARTVGVWVPEVVPNIFAFASLVAGALLLFSGATPPDLGRMAWLQDVVPLPVIELSHFLGSLAGGALLVLAVGLQRRLDGAYWLAALLLGAGAVCSLLKGLDYEEALVLGIMLAALLPCHDEFYRKASLTSEPFSPAWMTAMLVVLASAFWLGLFSYKHVVYSHELWWRFGASSDAPRFLRASVGVVGAGSLFLLARGLRPDRPAPLAVGEEERRGIQAIVERSSRTSARLALLWDKAFLLNDERSAFLMYAVGGRSWVALGDPVGPREAWSELIWRFREMCDTYAGRIVFYDVGKDTLDLYLDLGLTFFKIGEEARVSLAGFSLDGGSRKPLRHTTHQLARAGCRFELVPTQQARDLMPALKEASDAWLKAKGAREKRFSVGFFEPDYVASGPVAVVWQGPRLVAFANVWLGAGQEELSVDLMRYEPGAPDGVMDLLFVQLMVWGRAQGYAWFNFGAVPLSGLTDQPLAPLWNRLGAFAFRHGEHFYHFQGLRQYKEKFDPVWEPRYLACPGGWSLPRILTDVTALISGGLTGVIRS